MKGAGHDSLPAEVRQPSRRARPRAAAVATGAPRPAAASPSWDATAPADAPHCDADLLAFERQRLLDALDGGSSNKNEAARLLGMPRSTFVSKLKKHGLL